MSQEVFRWIALATAGTTLIPLIYFLIFRKAQPRQNQILALSLGISFIFDTISGALAYHQIPNVLLHNIYRIFAFPMIMWFYHETLNKRFLKVLVRLFIIGFLVMALLFGLDKGLNVVNHNTWTLSSILVTITSFFFVGDLNLMDESKFVKNRFLQSNIILNTSLALYYLTTIIVFGLMEYVFSHFTYEDMRYFWMSHNVAHVLTNIGITVAFYITAKRSYSPGHFQTINQTNRVS